MCSFLTLNLASCGVDMAKSVRELRRESSMSSKRSQSNDQLFSPNARGAAGEDPTDALA